MNHHIDAFVSFAAAVLAVAWPPSMSVILAFPVLGIPLTGLGSAMLGSGFSYLQRNGQKVEAVPLRVFGIAMDAFLGGWLAVALLRIKPLHQYGIDAIPIEALAGLLAFMMQVIRQRTFEYWDRAFQAVLNAIVGMMGSKAKKAEPEEPQP